MIVIKKQVIFKADIDLDDINAIEEQQLMADVIEEIVKQLGALKTGEDNAHVIVHYNAYAFEPQATFEITATTDELKGKIEEIVNTASPSY